MKKRVLSLLLASVLCLSLAACGSSSVEESPSPSADPSASAAPSAAPSIDVDLSQDILTFAAGDLAKIPSVITVNGDEVPTSRFLYWLALTCSYFENQYYYYGMTVQNCGDQILAMLLQDACASATYYTILNQKIAEYGCPLTDEQLATINSELAVGSKDHTTQKELYGFTDEDLLFFYSLSDYFDNLTSALVAPPTAEDLNDFVYQVKHILICTAVENQDGSISLATGGPATNEDGTPFTGTAEEYNELALAKAESLLSQLKAAAPEELEDLFDKLMHEHSEDGRDASGNLGAPDGYTATPGQMVPEFENAAFALEPGQVSEPVKSTYGYHIILRGEVKDLLSYEEAYSSAKLDELANEWMAAAETELNEAVESLDVAEFYSRYLAWQKAYAAQTEIPAE